MNTLELLSAMYRDVGMRVQGGGVWPADALIHLKCKRPSFFIVNTSEGNNIGTHWVALYLPEKGPFEFFDPLGHPPEHYHAYFKSFSWDSDTVGTGWHIKRLTRFCVGSIAYILDTIDVGI